MDVRVMLRDSGAPEQVWVQETFRLVKKIGGAGRRFLYIPGRSLRAKSIPFSASETPRWLLVS
jgi:hypothetical protein